MGGCIIQKYNTPPPCIIQKYNTPPWCIIKYNYDRVSIRKFGWFNLIKLFLEGIIKFHKTITIYIISKISCFLFLKSSWGFLREKSNISYRHWINGYT